MHSSRRGAHIARPLIALPGAPYLYVNGWQDRTASGRQFWYTANVNVLLFQFIRLDRNLLIRLGAPTWSVTEIVKEASTEIIRESVRDLEDQFANAYFSVNPK